jgi:hypothetical protein
MPEYLPQRSEVVICSSLLPNSVSSVPSVLLIGRFFASRDEFSLLWRAGLQPGRNGAL